MIYLSGAAKMFSDGPIVMHFSNRVGPCVVSAKPEISDFYWMILPVRTN